MRPASTMVWMNCALILVLAWTEGRATSRLITAGQAQDSLGQGGPDADRGHAAFLKRCTGCHALDANREGPRLRGVYGRHSGSVAGFSYSDAVRALKVQWDAELLNRWLTNPDAMAPGTDMEFHVANATERADIVRYLEVMSSEAPERR